MLLRIVIPVLVVFTTYCLVDALRSPAREVRGLPRLAWVVVIVLLPLLGGLAWLIAGRPRSVEDEPPARSAGPPRVLGPDDDPEFLRQLETPDPIDPPAGDGTPGETDTEGTTPAGGAGLTDAAEGSRRPDDEGADPGPGSGGRDDHGADRASAPEGDDDGGRDGGREAGRDSGREGGRDSGREGGRDGGRDGDHEGDRDGDRRSEGGADGNGRGSGRAGG